MGRPPPFNDLDAALAALGPEARNAKPAVAPLRLLSRARRVYLIASKHRARLACLAEFDLAALDRLPELIERAEQAEFLWVGQQRERNAFDLRKVRDDAIALRFQLVSAARYALRSKPEALSRFDGFYRRRTLASLIADLRRLADFIEMYPELASAPGLPEKPIELVLQLEDKLIRGNSSDAYDKAEGDRNALIALLALALQEVVSAARYLFRYEPEDLDRLVDRELRDRRRKARVQAAKRPRPGTEPG
jgi:hypothetical protein